MTRLTVAGMFLMLLCGCGKPEPPWGSVSGTVLQEGKPVRGALVLFSGREIGVETTATTDGEGRFTMRTDRIAGLPAGDYKVAVLAMPANRPEPHNGVEFPDPPPKPEVSSIPAHYGNIATSELNASVKKGDNHFEFQLQSR